MDDNTLAQNIALKILVETGRIAKQQTHGVKKIKSVSFSAIFLKFSEFNMSLQPVGSFSLFPFMYNEGTCPDVDRLIVYSYFDKFREILSLSCINKWTKGNLTPENAFSLLKTRYPDLKLEVASAFPKFKELHPTTYLTGICCNFFQKKVFSSAVFEKATYEWVYENLCQKTKNREDIEKRISHQKGIVASHFQDTENNLGIVHVNKNNIEKFIDEHPDPTTEEQSSLAFLIEHYENTKMFGEAQRCRLKILETQLHYSQLSFDDFTKELSEKGQHVDPEMFKEFQIITEEYRWTLTNELIKWEDRAKLIDVLCQLKENESETFKTVVETFNNINFQLSNFHKFDIEQRDALAGILGYELFPLDTIEGGEYTNPTLEERFCTFCTGRVIHQVTTPIIKSDIQLQSPHFYSFTPPKTCAEFKKLPIFEALEFVIPIVKDKK